MSNRQIAPINSIMATWLPTRILKNQVAPRAGSFSWGNVNST